MLSRVFTSSAQRAEQSGPCVERDRALREGCHHSWREPDVLGEHIESRFRIGRHLFRLESCSSRHRSLHKLRVLL